jgi:regulatory protein
MAGLRGVMGGAVMGVASWGMRERKPVPVPTEAKLYEQALAYLARYAATRAGVARVLARKVDRWAREAEVPDEAALVAAHAAIGVVVDRLAAAGVIDDAAFAASRARSLVRSGRSRVAVAAHLAARGVAGEVARQSLAEGGESELGAALVFARKRRIGPFARGEVEAVRALGMFARAGFSREVAGRALSMEFDEAEALVIQLKQA